jgi:hypothetical protein
LGITIHKVLAYPDLWKRLSKLGALEARRRYTWAGVSRRILAALGDLSRSPGTRKARTRRAAP